MISDYKIKYIKTKSKLRKIVTYNSEQKKAEHEYIVNKLSKIFQPSIFSKGYVVNESIYTNAYAHLYNDIFIKLDIKNFFESINKKRLKKEIYKDLNKYISPEDVELLVNKATISKKGLPLGLKTSPILSNIYLKSFDIKLHNMLKKIRCKNLIYTRYADDMIISFQKAEIYEQQIQKILSIVDMLVKKYCLKINEKKTKIIDFEHSKQARITGVSIVEKNGKRRLSVGRNQKRKFFYDVINIKKQVTKESVDKEKIKALKGKLSFYLSIEKTEFESFLTKNMKKELQELGYNSFIELVKKL